MKRVALYFGSFNPIHNGHLMLANYIAEYEGMDEVRFVVSPQNPFKKNQELLPDAWRLRTVREAVGSYGRFTVSDVEFHLEKPSYTFNTLSHFFRSEPDSKFFLVMGGDNLPNFHLWRNADGIVRMCDILVYPRRGYDVDVPERWKNHARLMENAPMVDVSSTLIRKAKKEGRDVRFFLPYSVWKMMEEADFERID